MSGALREFVKEYEWIHTSLGLLGNSAFFIGSVLFLFESLKTAGVWLFIIGALGMLIDTVGSAIIKLERHRGTLPSQQQ